MKIQYFIFFFFQAEDGIRDRAAAGEGEPRGHGQDRGGAPGEGDAERRRVPGHPVRVHRDPRREPGAPDAPGRRPGLGSYAFIGLESFLLLLLL